MASDDRQSDLFDEPPATYPERPGFVQGSDTSEQAADSLVPVVLTKIRATIFALIHGRGDYGATCDEIEVVLELRHQTASARCTELTLSGHIKDSGRRRLTRSRRRARVYTVMAPTAKEAAP